MSIKVGLTSIFLPLLLIAACVTSMDDENTLDTELAGQPLKKVALKEASKMTSYKHGSKSAKVESFACVSSNHKRTIIVNHSENESFTSQKVCKNWSVQAFANKGFNVIAINRPGFGRSTGPKDFSGGNSQAAIVAAAKDYSFTKTSPIVAVWGYSIGSIAAAFVSKKLSSIKYLIIGNGVFDTETLASKPVNDATIQKELDIVVASEGEDGYEDRSVEWDVEGLPKTILLYHGEMNPVVSYKRAESFRTTLATAEYKVQLFPVKNAKHDIDWPTHQQVLRSLLAKIK